MQRHCVYSEMMLSVMISQLTDATDDVIISLNLEVVFKDHLRITIYVLNKQIIRTLYITNASIM